MRKQNDNSKELRLIYRLLQAEREKEVPSYHKIAKESDLNIVTAYYYILRLQNEGILEVEILTINNRYRVLNKIKINKDKLRNYIDRNYSEFYYYLNKIQYIIDKKE